MAYYPDLDAFRSSVERSAAGCMVAVGHDPGTIGKAIRLYADGNTTPVVVGIAEDGIRFVAQVLMAADMCNDTANELIELVRRQRGHRVMMGEERWFVSPRES